MPHPLEPILKEGWVIQNIEVDGVYVLLEMVSDAAYAGIHILEELYETKNR